MKLVREQLDRVYKLVGKNHSHWNETYQLKAATILVEAAKVEAMIEMGGELNDISTALNHIDGSLVNLDQ